MFRDPELPAGFQEADFEQAELVEAGQAIRAKERKGICSHGSRVAHKSPAFYYEQEHMQAGELLCCECGAISPDDGRTWGPQYRHSFKRR